MDVILNWLFAGAEVIPELVVIVKLSLMYYAVNFIVDILDICKKGVKY